MTLQNLQGALFKLYLNTGYRLAHRLSPDSFIDHLGLDEESADIVRKLSPQEVDDFATALRGKQLLSISYSLPTTFKWLQEQHPALTREFQAISVPSRSDDSFVLAKRFVAFLRESRDFYDSIPKALPDVAQLELMLMMARKDQALRVGQGSADPVPSGAFSLNSLCWTPARTSAGSFSVDALGILLGRRSMTDSGAPSCVVVSPAPSGVRPTILKISAPAYAVLDAMKEPITVRQLLSRCQARGVEVSEDALIALLSKLESSQVVCSYHMEATDA
jgi:hypothetical protein